MSYNEPEPQPPPDIRRDAVNAVLAMGRPCWCEWADIGGGCQRVHEHPECPTHTEGGAAIWYLETLADRLAEGLHRLAHEEWYGPFRAGFRAAIHAVRTGKLSPPPDEDDGEFDDFADLYYGE